MDIDFEWDETNREPNRRKHGVDFADAVEIFYDDLSCSRPDPDHHAEHRISSSGSGDGYAAAATTRP
jgi:uncharacterized DUF497 family protein